MPESRQRGYGVNPRLVVISRALLRAIAHPRRHPRSERKGRFPVPELVARPCGKTPLKNAPLARVGSLAFPFIDHPRGLTRPLIAGTPAPPLSSPPTPRERNGYDGEITR